MIPRRCVTRALLIFSAFCAGCTWHASDGSRRTLIVGIGVLKEQGTPGQATVSTSTTLGLAAQLDTPRSGLALGFANSVTTRIPAAWNGTLHIDRQSITANPTAPRTQP